MTNRFIHPSICLFKVLDVGITGFPLSREHRIHLQKVSVQEACSFEIPLFCSDRRLYESEAGAVGVITADSERSTDRG